MSAYLLSWNPENWDWDSIDKSIEEIQTKGYGQGRWSFGNRKNVDPESRFFMLRLGAEPKGIFASGKIISDVYQDEHWRDSSKIANYVDVEFEILLNPSIENILDIESIEHVLPGFLNRHKLQSGTVLSAEETDFIQAEWEQLLGKGNILIDPDEVQHPHCYYEGATIEVSVNRYERSLKAREECLRIHGSKCMVCGFSFEDFYGQIGRDYIQVHHVVSLASVKKEYKVNPSEDLIPVCPNCHAMLHCKNPPYTIDELKAMIKEPEHHE
ncbi:HNH endonuclease [bacterium]|nr:HNH endonuclease [bacterium]